MSDKEYTKHYFIEGERVCTKVGGGFRYAPTDPDAVQLQFMGTSTATSVSDDLWTMTIRGVDCSGYPSARVSVKPKLRPARNDASRAESQQYFYHPDHLGSSSFVTDAAGLVEQHMQYLPYGELFVNQQNSTYDTRYKFSAKELDPETNYSYFGARYGACHAESVNSDLSVWLSVDPLSDKYPSISPYNYCFNNPINFRDIYGLEGEPDEEVGPSSTDLSTLDLESKPTRLNILVMGAGNNENNTDPTESWSEEEKNDENTIALYVDNKKDLNRKLASLRKDYGKEIGNVIFSSHGSGYSAKFYIGSSRISSATDLDFLKDDLSANSIVFITACHTGSPTINGDKLVAGLSQQLGVTVIANQGWSNGTGRPGGELYYNNAMYFESTNAEWAKSHAGWYTIGYPTDNGTMLMQGFDVRITKSGLIYFNTTTLTPLIYNNSRNENSNTSGK